MLYAKQSIKVILKAVWKADHWTPHKSKTM